MYSRYNFDPNNYDMMYRVNYTSFIELISLPKKGEKRICNEKIGKYH